MTIAMVLPAPLTVVVFARQGQRPQPSQAIIHHRRGPTRMEGPADTISKSLPGSYCLGHRQRLVEVHLIGGLPVKDAVWAPRVIDVDVVRQGIAGMANGVMGFQVRVLALDRLSKPPDEHVLAPAGFAVHACGDARVLERTWTPRW